jgi:hypothetical protein
MGFFKYDLTKLIGSGARCLYAPTSFTVPVSSGLPTMKINSIIELTTALSYAVKSGWVDFGAAREGQGAQYDRSITTQDWAIEQAQGAVATDVTDVPRTITVPMAEISTAGITILENAPSSRAVSAASGQSAQTAVDFGSFENISRYRIALIGQRRKGIGFDVTEPDATVRGAFVAVVLFSASISANATQYELQKGQLANVSVEFEAFPESTITDSTRDRGAWIFESSGTIA